jgi:hypothetical protein
MAERLVIFERRAVDPTEFDGQSEAYVIKAELDLEYQGIVHGRDRRALAEGVGRVLGIESEDLHWDYVHDCAMPTCPERRGYQDVYVVGGAGTKPLST